MQNRPKLRFKEFNDEWQEWKFGDKGTFLKGNNLGKSDITSDGYPCLLYGELYTKYTEVAKEIYSHTDRKQDNQVIGHVNDVLLPSSGETAIDISTATCLQVDNVLLGGDLNIFRSKEIDGRFLSYELNHSKRRKIASIAQGATVVHLYSSYLKSVKLSSPCKLEQQKIAEFLSKVDEVIAEREAEVKDLEQKKKGLMQKLFSQQLRFTDSDNNPYPEWEEDLIGNLFGIKAGGDIDTKRCSKTKTEIYKYPVYANALTSSGLYGYTDDYKVSGNTITVTGRGDVGHATPRHEQYYPIVRLLVLTPKYNANVDFFASLINSTKIFIESTGVPQLTSPQLAKVKVKYPCLEEQEKIANVLSKLDELIEEKKALLSDWQQFKKGLLQQMFV